MSSIQNDLARVTGQLDSLLGYVLNTVTGMPSATQQEFLAMHASAFDKLKIAFAKAGQDNKELKSSINQFLEAIKDRNYIKRPYENTPSVETLLNEHDELLLLLKAHTGTLKQLAEVWTTIEMAQEDQQAEGNSEPITRARSRHTR